MTVDTTPPSYWLNWRFLLSAICLIVAMVLSTFIIWKFEFHSKSNNQQPGPNKRDPVRLYKGEAWGTCSKSIHPICLLAFRILAFCAMLALILADSIIHSFGIFYFYTQWTFTLVTVYFAIGCSHSIYGCLYNRNKADFEQGSNVAPSLGEDAEMHTTNNRILNRFDDPNCKTASLWEYSLQIIFQMCCGAVALTDSVFWLVLYPFYTGKDFRLHFLIICMHSVNAVFLLGDVILNSLQFPFFRIAYFVMWTCIFVVFQWIFHAFVSKSWPYAFLDLSSTYAPLWYLGVGLLHFPCFGIFTLIFKIKQFCLSR
ncbi:hypothetical protein ACP275_05G018000 [Erythranthe tilingii]